MSNIVLQERDKKIFSYLLKHKVSSIYQIKKDLLHIPRAIVSRRLNLLAEHGYLKRHLFCKKSVFGLLNRGAKEIMDHELLSHAPSSLFEMDEKKLEHDLLLSDIYSMFLSNQIEYQTHNDITLLEGKDFYQIQIPDAILTLGKDHVRLALELELNQKQDLRYQKIFTSYYGKEGIDAVLYVVPTNGLKEKILSIDKTLLPFKKRKIFVVLLDQFFKNPLSCVFTASDKTGIILNKIA